VADGIVRFSDEELGRINLACQSIATSREEFIHWAVLQACDEVIGVNNAIANAEVHIPKKGLKQRYARGDS
jgi:hypothetical protein